MNAMMRLFAAAGLGAVLALATPALAQQRDPAYQAARAAGQVGEKPDGYLGFVGTPSAELRRLVDDLNIRRREAYTRSARERGSTVE